MSTKSKPTPEIPLWQQLTGMTPEREASLSAAARNGAIRKLLQEVETQARAEMNDDVPAGERTVFWDPLTRICMRLGISRTKLSALSRELTGLRAHELTDRIKAATLPLVVEEHLQTVFRAELDTILERIDPAQWSDRAYRLAKLMPLIKRIRDERRGPARTRWAYELGYPNPSRLARACVIAQGMSYDDLELRALFAIVQKFVDQRGGKAAPVQTAKPEAKPAAKPAPVQKFAERPKQVKKEEPATPISAEAQAIIDDAVDFVLSRGIPA